MAAFAKMATYKSIPEEDRDMFRASAYYTLNAGFVVIPSMDDADVNKIPMPIIEAILEYRNAWIDFVEKWRGALDCFDYTKYVKMKDNSELTVSDIQNEEFAAFLFSKAFEPRLAEIITVKQSIADEIAAGVRKKPSLSNLKSASDLFLMLNFTLTIKTVSTTHNVEVIELIDFYINKIEKQKAAEYRRKYSSNALLINKNAIIEEPPDDDLPPLIEFEDISDNTYRQIRQIIYLLCAPMLSNGELNHDGAIVRNAPKQYPEWVPESAITYLDFATDIVIHIIVLFLHEHVQTIFDYKLYELRTNRQLARKNNFNIVLTMEDYQMALREMYCDSHRDKFGDLDQDRTEKMYLFGIQIINENKELFLGVVNELTKHFTPLAELGN